MKLAFRYSLGRSTPGFYWEGWRTANEICVSLQFWAIDTTFLAKGFTASKWNLRFATVLQLYSINNFAKKLKEKQGFYFHYHSRRVAMVWNDMQWYSYSLPFLLMQTFWMDTHWMDPYWWDTCWTDMYWWDMRDMYWWDTFGIPADAHLLNGYALNGYASHGYVLVGYVLKEKVLVGYVLVGYVLNGYVCKTDANLLNGYALNGYVLVGYVLNGYVLVGYVLVGYVLNGYVNMCGLCVMCWICVGYVWCEIRQQSSEEPCDETSFGNNVKTC